MLSSHLLISPSEIFMALKRRAGAVPQGSEAPVGGEMDCAEIVGLCGACIPRPEVHEVRVCGRACVCV